MKKLVLFASATLMIGLASCGGGKSTDTTAAADSTAMADSVPAYTLMTNLPTTDISAYPKDKNGAISLFDGKTLNGWRGYDKDSLPAGWDVQNGAIHLSHSGKGEAGGEGGGDLIFAHKFKAFELTFEWKVAKGANSGVFIMIQEVEGQPAYISAPEFQILDNENHPDAKLGVDGNRQAASLYDMIPAKPQQSKPFGEWNKGKIMVYEGTVVHYENDMSKPVVEYHLWTPQWTEMLQNSKFSQEKWPLAFELLNNCGGENHEGYIGFQDHGDEVWYRNVTLKEL